MGAVKKTLRLADYPKETQEEIREEAKKIKDKLDAGEEANIPKQGLVLEAFCELTGQPYNPDAKAKGLKKTKSVGTKKEATVKMPVEGKVTLKGQTSRSNFDFKHFSGKVTCAGCQESKSVRPDVYAKRIKTYGSEDNLVKNYKCRKCRPNLKQIRKEKAAKEAKKDSKANKPTTKKGGKTNGIKD